MSRRCARAMQQHQHRQDFSPSCPKHVRLCIAICLQCFVCAYLLFINSKRIRFGSNALLAQAMTNHSAFSDEAGVKLSTFPNTLELH